MLSPTLDAEHIQNKEPPPQRGTRLHVLLSRTAQGEAAFSCVPLAVLLVQARTQLAGSDFCFCCLRPSERLQGHLLVVSTRAPVQVSQKSKCKGEGAGRACVGRWARALIRNTGALDRASLYKLLGPVFTS